MEVSAFTPLPLYPQERIPRYPLGKGLDKLWSLSGHRGEENILDLCRELNLDSSIVQPVAYTFKVEGGGDVFLRNVG
jgi:hypothetical protein